MQDTKWQNLVRLVTESYKGEMYFAFSKDYNPKTLLQLEKKVPDFYFMGNYKITASNEG